MQMPRVPLLLSSLLLTAAAPAAAQEMINDDNVTWAVEREFRFDHAVPGDRIDVVTASGVVTLRGEVPNLLAKERALRIAETVKGVRSVVNLVEVDPPAARTDADIQRDVEHALLQDPAADAYEVVTAVNNGRVTLTGTVESWHEKRLAEAIAKAVHGVTDVTNSIDIAFAVDRPDHEIRNEIVEAMRWNPLVDDGLIEVQVAAGAVTLTGVVGSAAEKRQACYDAWTSGVTRVDDSALTVARWARDPDLRTDKYVPKSDDAIRRAVEDALLRDPRTLSFKVETSVSSGIVTLRGVVDNLKAKRAAGADARNTIGVVAVENNLKVRPAEERSDEAITADVRAALLRDPWVERFEILVRAYDGTVYLSGTVDSYFEKVQADDLAARVNGVTKVVNNLEVSFGPPLLYDPWVDRWDAAHTFDRLTWDPAYTYIKAADWQIEQNIEDEFFWSPFVNGDDVEVTVDDGIATLEGVVDTHVEKSAAEDNAYEGGAIYVRNLLAVENQ